MEQPEGGYHVRPHSLAVYRHGVQPCRSTHHRTAAGQPIARTRRDPARRRLCHAFLRNQARCRRTRDRHQRHGREHHRRARAAHAAARPALGRRAAEKTGHRRSGRPGVRRGARRRQPAQRLSDRDLGLRPAPRRQRLDAGHVGSRRRPRHHLPARCLDRLRAARVRAGLAQRPAQQRCRARQHRLRPRQQAVVRLGHGNRDDPPHPRRRRRRPRRLRSRHAGPVRLHQRGERRAHELAADRVQHRLARPRRGLQQPVRLEPAMLELRRKRPAGVGSRRAPRPDEERNAAVLRGVVEPGLRADRLGPGLRRRQAQRGVVGAAHLDRRLRHLRRAARIHAAGLLRAELRHRACRLQPAGERHLVLGMRTAPGDAGRRARRHSQSRSRCGECVRQSARGARLALRGRQQGHLAADRSLRRRLLRPRPGRSAVHAGELLGRHCLRSRLRRTVVDRRPGQAGPVRVDHG